jgi:hypothetical protein
MGMSPTLLRPRQNLHPDAASWASRVVANGGSVGSSLPAVNTFCKAIAAAGIRDRFYRLNLFCGASNASLDAVRTPLFRGPSLSGTQYGNTTDTNANFVAGDYAETGASGGLTGNGTTKTLATGLQPNAAGISAFNSHLSFYSRAQITANNCAIGGFGGGGTSPTWQLLTYGGLSLFYYRSGGSSNSGIEAAAWSGANRAGHLIAIKSASDTAAVYRNGADLGMAATVSNTNVWTTTDVAPLFVFGRNNQGSADQVLAATLQGYSLGLSMTAGQASAYYAAMQAFQTALGRQL